MTIEETLERQKIDGPTVLDAIAEWSPDFCIKSFPYLFHHGKGDIFEGERKNLGGRGEFKAIYFLRRLMEFAQVKVNRRKQKVLIHPFVIDPKFGYWALNIIRRQDVFNDATTWTEN